MPHAPDSADVEQLRYVAQDPEGEPLTSDDLAFLASGQGVLRIGDGGELFVVGIAQVRHYSVWRVRTAIGDARAIGRLIALARADLEEESARRADASG